MKVVPAAAVLVTVSRPWWPSTRSSWQWPAPGRSRPLRFRATYRPVETLEEVGQVLRRDGLAGVVYRQPQPLLVPLQGEGDGAARPGVLHGVVQEDHHQPAELPLVSAQGQAG